MHKQTETLKELYFAPECDCYEIKALDVLCSSRDGGINDLIVDDFDWSEE